MPRGAPRGSASGEDLHVDDSLGLAVGSLSAPGSGPGGALIDGCVRRGATGAFEVAHHHASLADGGDADTR